MRFTLKCMLFVHLAIISVAGYGCGCGETRLEASQTVNSIESVNYPGPYCHNTDCTYFISADEGYHIMVNVTELDLENSYDYLSIYDGSIVTTGAPLYKLSGRKNEPQIIKSSSNKLTVKFHTDSGHEESYNGFRLFYIAGRNGSEQIVEESINDESCSCERQIYSSNETSAEIKSPNYPNSVCNTVTYCVYEIEASSDFPLKLVLTVEIKQSYKLTIFETTEYEGRPIQLQWYSYTPTARKTNTFYFAKNVGARIIMEYDDTLMELYCGYACRKPTKTIFSAVFNRVTRDINCPYPVFTASNEPKTVDFSFKDDNNDARTNCNLLFLAEPTMRIIISLQRPAYCRAIVVQYENNTEIKSTGSDYYYYKHDFVFQSETNEMTLKASKNARDCQLTLTYAASTTDCKCNANPNILTDNATTVTHLSPAFPYSFCPGLECANEYTNNLNLDETSGDVKGFLLTWNDFQLADNDKKLQLTIKVDMGDFASVTFESEGSKHILIGKILTINFKSINALGLHGYNVTVEAVVIPKKCLCSNTYIKTLPREEGRLELLLPASCQLIYCHYQTSSVSDDSYDYSYSRNTLVFAWMIIQLASEGDKLTVQEDSGEERNFFYNSGQEERKFFSQRNLVLSFERDQRLIGINKTIMDSKIDVKWQSGKRCFCLLPDDKATQEQKFIHSPNYPQPYCNDMNCIYKLEADEGYHIVVNITEVDIENYQDHLYFFDGNNTSYALLKKYSGHQKQLPLLKSTSNQLTILFQTDKDIVEKGFVLFFWAEPTSSFDSQSDNSLSSKVAESHMSIISVLLSACVVFVVVSLVFGVLLLRKRGSFTFLTTFRNPVFATPTVYYSNDNVSTRSFASRREEF